MSSQSLGSYQQSNMNSELDRNHVPPVEIPQEDGSSALPLDPVINVEAIDDDVIELSPRSFAQATANARRNQRRTRVDTDLEDRSVEPTINCDLHIKLECINCLMSENVRMSYEAKQAPPEPPKPPVFNCPICMSPFVEEMSTRCGHIFCKECIKAAITAQGKCPTCRRKVTVRQLIRVFLPSAT